MGEGHAENVSLARRNNVKGTLRTLRPAEIEDRVMKAASLLLAGLLAAGCAPRSPRVIQTEYYRIVQVSENEFAVWTMGETGLDLAKKLLGCGVCSESPAGQVFFVTRYSN